MQISFELLDRLIDCLESNEPCAWKMYLLRKYVLVTLGLFDDNDKLSIPPSSWDFGGLKVYNLVSID